MAIQHTIYRYYKFNKLKNFNPTSILCFMIDVNSYFGKTNNYKCALPKNIIRPEINKEDSEISEVKLTFKYGFSLPEKNYNWISVDEILNKEHKKIEDLNINIIYVYDNVSEEMIKKIEEFLKSKSIITRRCKSITEVKNTVDRRKIAIITSDIYYKDANYMTISIDYEDEIFSVMKKFCKWSNVKNSYKLNLALLKNIKQEQIKHRIVISPKIDNYSYCYNIVDNEY